MGKPRYTPSSSTAPAKDSPVHIGDVQLFSAANRPGASESETPLERVERVVGGAGGGQALHFHAVARILAFSEKYHRRVISSAHEP